MDNNEKYLRSIAESLKSIDRSLKKISGENSVKTIESVKKTYAETYFAKDDDGKWSEK